MSLPAPWRAPDFARAVLAWYRQHGRTDLPWQRDPSPYRVWVAEIMLQQTQVATVIPYFTRFLARFPDPAAVAAAELDEVLRFWVGLGYYARARHLHQAARRIRDEHGGQFPSAFAAVQALPGIGRSTAGAILSFAYGRCYPLLDGNVQRVLTRCFALDGWPGSAPTRARLWRLAETLLPCAVSAAEPGAATTPGAPVAAYNQALMDLGATLCTAARPRCADCPLAAHAEWGCLARATGRIQAYPAPKPRHVRARRTLRWLLIRDPRGTMWLERRAPRGIWGGLWSAPELPAEQEPAAWCHARFGVAPSTLRPLAPRTHCLTHLEFMIEPWLLDVSETFSDTNIGRWVDASARARLGMPAPLQRLLAALASERS